ncbi:histidine kinase [Dactylosporangium matsuzakiense]|uniref:histidine kinase n=2 Tax=Dactylosporangium matsuzakiense TaxID=53360 RepID=A0A9W6KH20_9ACTN|nr:two-component sensor histidine kinase [Dactylosporangium matsuzakiense]
MSYPRTSVRGMRVDLVIGIVVGLVVLATTHGSPTAIPVEPAALTAVIVACGSLALRRRHPLTVFLVSSVAAEGYLVLNHSSTNGTLILTAPLIALYTVAESQVRRRALIIGVLAVLAFAGLHMLVKPASWLGVENLALAALGGLAVAAGDGARSRREYLAEVEARAERAEQAREAEALRRVTEERLRIARDLHDAVGHQLALITVQAGVAAHLLDSQPARAREALGNVRSAGRTALAELSDTIGLLRRPGELVAPLDPLPGLSGLPELLASHRAAGQSIDTSVSAAPDTSIVEAVVSVPIDLTAYRVVQEALTNACKHAPSAPVHVALLYEPGALRIRIDNGPPQSPAADHAYQTARAQHVDRVEVGGLGLVGMRERVLALGGSLVSGPRPDGGFRVEAVLPIGAPVVDRGVGL